MTTTFIVSSNDFETTVFQNLTTQNNTLISQKKFAVNAKSNSVVRNWLECKSLPTEPSEEVDAAFVWAGV